MSQLGLTVRGGVQLVFWFEPRPRVALALARSGPCMVEAWRHWHARLYRRGQTGGVGPWQPRSGRSWPRMG